MFKSKFNNLQSKSIGLRSTGQTRTRDSIETTRVAFFGWYPGPTTESGMSFPSLQLIPMVASSDPTRGALVVTLFPNSQAAANLRL